jgi:hypothetical protein
MAKPTPAGVPVEMMSPAERQSRRERRDQCRMSKIIWLTCAR